MEKCFLKVPPQSGDKPCLPPYPFPSLPMFLFVSLLSVCYLTSVLPQVTGDSLVCDHRPCGSTNLGSVPSTTTSSVIQQGSLSVLEP